MTNKELLEKVTKGDCNKYCMMSADKSKLVRFANFLRSAGLVCEIKSNIYQGMVLHTLTIIKKLQ